jgi:hypothetical protein
MADGGEGSSAEAGGEGGESTAAEMPAGVPTKFWDGDAGSVNYEAWGKSYNEMGGKLRSQKAELTDSIRSELETERFANRPESASDYKLEMPESIAESMPEGVEWQWEDGDPMVGWWRDVVHEAGGDQDMFNSGIEMYMASQLGGLPDLDSEMEALGDHAAPRVERVQMWAQQNLSEEGMAGLTDMMTSAEAIGVMEELMSKMGEAPFSAQDIPGRGDGTTYADLRAKMEDPKYWNPLLRDDAYVKDVEAGFQRLAELEDKNLI